jgi:predicted outer membrane lipoprotein
MRRILGVLAACALLVLSALPAGSLKYQSTQNGQQRCEICLQFEPPDHCKIVQSPITPHGWCQYFAARENAH